MRPGIHATKCSKVLNKLSKHCPKLSRFCQSGKKLPNLVTLDRTPKPVQVKPSPPGSCCRWERSPARAGALRRDVHLTGDCRPGFPFPTQRLESFRHGWTCRPRRGSCPRWTARINTIKLILLSLNCRIIMARFWCIVWDAQWVFKLTYLCLLLRITTLSSWWCKFTDANPFSV